ncbi:MAG: HEAT repeat domain-containing protein [Tepidisphaerales bacterium]
MTDRLLAGGIITAMLLGAGCTNPPGATSADPATPVVAGSSVDPAVVERARNTLAELLTHNDETVRAHAIEAFKDSMGPAGRQVYINALRDQSSLVRFAGAMAIGEVRLAEAKPLLVPLLTDADPSVQVASIFAMHRLGETKYSVGLERSLGSPDKWTRANTCMVLGRLGEKSAVKILKPALRDSPVEVRLQAAEALGRRGDEDGLAFLVATTISGNPGHQLVGILALAGPKDTRVIDHVRAGLSSTYQEVVLVTARALAMLGSNEAYDKALAATTSTDARQRSLAALALGASGKPQAAAPLTSLLKDSDPDVRVAASLAILQLR